MGTHRVSYGPRAFRQDASNAMKGDIVRGLIELITNSDDAYGDSSHGKIRVEESDTLRRAIKAGLDDRQDGQATG